MCDDPAMATRAECWMLCCLYTKGSPMQGTFVSASGLGHNCHQILHGTVLSSTSAGVRTAVYCM